MRELRVGNCSIFFKTIFGVEFDIETRKEHGIAVYMEGKKILDVNPKGNEVKNES